MQGGQCGPQAGRRGPGRVLHTVSSRATKIVRVAEAAGWARAPSVHLTTCRDHLGGDRSIPSLLHTEQGQRELTTEVQKTEGP